MTVFKTILKILNKLKGMIILYTAILVAITALNQTSGNNMTNFEDSKPSVLIVNKDSEDNITKGFEDYISKHSEIKDIDFLQRRKLCNLYTKRFWEKFIRWKESFVGI